MKKVFGIMAHVDAGKTTLSEQILFYGKAIRQPGRVDHKNAFLDCHEIERERGITVYSDQAFFQIEEDEYYLVDTPGHADFISEVERTLDVIDYGVIVISATDGVQGQTETIWNCLRERKIPVFIFVNKMDMETADSEWILAELHKKLSNQIVSFTKTDILCDLSDEMIELAASSSEIAMEKYFEGKLDKEEVFVILKKMIKQCELYPCMFGAALQDDGVKEFLQQFHILTDTEYDTMENMPFAGRVYKIQYDSNGERMAFIKVLAGKLSVRDEILLQKDGEIQREKVNQLKLISGNKVSAVATAYPGELVGVTGLKSVTAGAGIGDCNDILQYQFVPALKVKVLYDSNIPDREMIRCFQMLEDENPMLGANWDAVLKQLEICIMGMIQLEVLQRVVKERFGYTIQFTQPEVLYMETPACEVTGYGHFEPLRHYAEVSLKLIPLKEGSGLQYESSCHPDQLAMNFQNAIRTHVFEKIHKGILTGSPLTDVKIVLNGGIAHIKHTEGGDFREATYRAIRQGLEKSGSVLLEPVYEFTIEVESQLIGRVLSDITKMKGSFETPLAAGENSIITGTCPVSTFMNYAESFMIYTKGKGRISAKVSRYQRCHNPDDVIKKINYDKERDLENVSSSVFCAKGTSFVVKWDEAEQYMHLLK
ncbi:GTP-binding protein [Anaeromicropila populeti]|uniref:Small GTP-binding protein domain-containing protein n=1 Tax=Anaeromicropila populeti TaxID=37658 RepID=A0A1I6KR58_9FIRM|nr:TetM/TetW/TetO/TetS family tetracycline resistance ribosomal protection protein [Anaeromicropila populeti]SFR93723.1 small GTP-binding protein domain-containing protein [Anaeromicropila populeti]